MNPGGLVPQGNFAQNGTLDWVRLGEGMMAFLGRVVNYGVDPFTVVLGAQMAQQLPLGPKGEKRAISAVNSLTRKASFNKALWFGFGITSIPQLLATYVEGLAFLAISAALSEVYNEDVVTKILHEILLCQNPPRESTPSLQSWLKIVTACAGTFATTPFGKRAETFMGYHPSETSLFANVESEQFDERWRSCSSPRDIAKALVNLGKVSRKEMESVTIVGGGDVGFLAAVAEWLFDLSIVIVDGNENVFYYNSEPGSAVQARFVFRDRSDALPSQRMDLEASRKIVQLKDVSDIIFANDKHHEMCTGGRLGWSYCLSSAFGATFQNLKATRTIVGNTLGSASRIFRAVAKAEPGIDIDTCKNWIYYTDAGSGLGYVQNLKNWFPELEFFETATQEAARLNYFDARNNYQSNIALLARHCVCVYCSPSTSEQVPDTYCVVVMVETILKAALILSNVSVKSGLEPKRFGFDRLYQRQIEDRPKDQATRERMEEKMGPIVWVIEPERENEHLYKVDHRIRLMIDGAMGLFTPLKELEDSSSSAFASGGICAYRETLGGLSMYDDYGCSLARIHIIPGRIEWQGVAFNQIQDRYQDQADEFRMDTDDGRIVPEEMNFRSGDPSLVMEVQDSIKMLSVAYRLSNSRQHVLNIPPTYIANNALATHGLVHCLHPAGYNRGRRAIRGDVDFQVQTYHGKEVALYRAPYDSSVCAALAIADMHDPQYHVVCDDKCVECALQTAISQAGTANPLLIVSYG